MNLWIRSQDRRYLIKTEYLYMVHDEENKKAYIGDKMAGHIAKYKTKERALEVLDEIQKLLMPIMKSTPIIEEDIKPEYTYRHYESKGSDIEVIQLNTYVYQMPKE